MSKRDSITTKAPLEGISEALEGIPGREYRAGALDCGMDSTLRFRSTQSPAIQPKNPALFTKGGPSVIVRRPRSLRLERSSGGNGIERTVKPELTSGKKVPSIHTEVPVMLPCVSVSGLSNVVNRIALYKRV